MGVAKKVNKKLDICYATLQHISNLKDAIINNFFNDFFREFSDIEKQCYKYDDYVNTHSDPNSVWYSSSAMLECLSDIEKYIFTNDLLGVTYSIYTLESMVNAAINSMSEDSKETENEH